MAGLHRAASSQIKRSEVLATLVMLLSLVGWIPSVRAQYLPEEIFRLQNMGNAAGFSVAAADIDDDGDDDLILGAPFDDGQNSSIPLCNSGAVTVVRNVDSGSSWTGFQHIFHPDVSQAPGDAVNAAFGFAVAAGDLDGDGLAEIIVGAPLTDAPGMMNAGAVFVYRKSSAEALYALRARFVGETAGALLGTSIAITADLDGDGWKDIVVGAPRSTLGGSLAGTVYALNSQSIDTVPPIWRTHGSAGDQLGRSVDARGKLAGAPSRDVIAGAPGFGSSGAVRALNGLTGAVLGTGTPPVGSSRFGEAVLFVSDLHTSPPDGRSEFLVSDPSRGEFHLFSYSSPSTTLVRHWTVQVDAASAFGASMARVDLNGDGTIQAAVGAPDFVSAFGDNTGRVHVFDVSLSGAVEVASALGGEEAGERFGLSIASGDFLGSSPVPNVGADLAVGAPFADALRTNELAIGVRIAEGGEVRVYDGSLLWTELDRLRGTFCGESFAHAIAFRAVANEEPWMMVGMPLADTPAPLGEHCSCDAGRVFVYDGAGQFRFSIPSAGGGEMFGTSVTAVNDLSESNPNSTDEFIVVGAPGTGVIRLFQFVGDSAVLIDERQQSDDDVDPLADGTDLFGETIVRLGEFLIDPNIEAPAAEEIAVAAPAADVQSELVVAAAGKVFIYSVTPSGFVFRALLNHPDPGINDQFGLALAGPGDIDLGAPGGNATPELLIGVPNRDVLTGTNNGQVFMYSSTPFNLVLRATIVSPTQENSAFFGRAVSGAGEFSAASAGGEVAVGIPGGTFAGVQRGRVEVFDPFGAFVAAIGTTAVNSSGEFGFSLAELDMPGSLTDGFFAGVPAYDMNTGDSIPGRGRVYVVLGVSPGVPIAIDPVFSYAETGSPARVGQVLAHTPITIGQTPLGRLMVSAQFADVDERSDEYVTAPRTITDLGRVFGFDFLNEEITLP